MNNKKAFTITEILLVMSIIGFVAALTIPAMVKDILKTQYITGARKTYTDVNYIFKKIVADKECDNDLKCTGIFATGTDSNTLGTELTKYIKTAKNCGISTNQDCWPPQTNDNFDGKSATNTNFNSLNYYYKFITTDGASFAIHNATEDANADCANDASTGLLGVKSYMTQVCGIVYVDVNGWKKPNTKGKDTFIYYITNGRGPLLYPAGGKDDKASGTNDYWNDGSRNFCYKTTNQEGKYCTGRLVEQNWEIDYF